MPTEEIEDNDAALEPENEAQNLTAQPESAADEDSLPGEGTEKAPPPVASTEPSPDAIRSAYRRAVRAGLNDTILEKHAENPDVLNDLAEQAEYFATTRPSSNSQQKTEPADDFKLDEIPEFDETKYDDDAKPQVKAMNLYKKGLQKALSDNTALRKELQSVQDTQRATQMWSWFNGRVKSMPDAGEIYGQGDAFDFEPGSAEHENRAKLFDAYQKIASRTGKWDSSSLKAAHEQLFAARAKLKAKAAKQQSQVINTPTARRAAPNNGKTSKAREESINRIEEILSQ